MKCSFSWLNSHIIRCNTRGCPLIIGIRPLAKQAAIEPSPLSLPATPSDPTFADTAPTVHCVHTSCSLLNSDVRSAYPTSHGVSLAELNLQWSICSGQRVIAQGVHSIAKMYRVCPPLNLTCDHVSSVYCLDLSSFYSWSLSHWKFCTWKFAQQDLSRVTRAFGLQPTVKYRFPIFLQIIPALHSILALHNLPKLQIEAIYNIIYYTYACRKSGIYHPTWG